MILDEESPSSRADTPISEDSSQPLGIGLAVVARYVRNMNGQIRVRSELGKGTIFGIELPFDHAAGTPNAPVISPPAAVLATAPETNKPSLTVALPRSLSSSSLPGLSTTELGSPHTLEANITPPTTINTILASPSKADYPSPNAPSDQGSPIEARGGTFPFPRMSREHTPWERPLNVLIAEDNPINARLLTRRLEKVGHTVSLAVDGQECHDFFVAAPRAIDVILMDLQMPLVDGSTSASMIRRHEKLNEHVLKERTRVPVIAVSASLTEGQRFNYIQSGFDGWILKPIDFPRLDLLLRGIGSGEVKRRALYGRNGVGNAEGGTGTGGRGEKTGWEGGGWFLL